MSGISPSYHFEALVLRNMYTNIIGGKELDIDVEARKRTMISGGVLLFDMPLLGMYRFSTGFLDAIQGIVSLIFFLKRGELFLRGCSNMIRGTVEMLSLASLCHFWKPNITRKFLNWEPFELDTAVRVAVVVHIICLVSILIYDGMLLNYCESKIKRLSPKSQVELYHDSVLVKTLQPASSNKLTYEDWMYQINKYGNLYTRI